MIESRCLPALSIFSTRTACSCGSPRRRSDGIFGMGQCTDPEGRPSEDGGAGHPKSDFPLGVHLDSLVWEGLLGFQ